MDDIIQICKEVKYADYRNRTSLTWLRKKLIESIRIIQLIDISSIDISTTQCIDNIYDIIKKSNEWSSPKDKFTDTAKELTYELQGFINRHT